MDKEINARIAKAGSCFGAMNKFMCNRGHISIETKMKVLNCVIIPTIMYACETWNLTVAQENSLNVIEMRWLRAILGINMMDFIPNYDIRLVCGGVIEVGRLIEKQRLRYLGHVIREDEYNANSLTNIMLNWDNPGKWKKPKGSPKTTWRRAINRSLKKVGLVKLHKKNIYAGPPKVGRPAKTAVIEKVEISEVADWEITQITARDRDEWRMLTLSIENFEFHAKSRT